MNTVYEDYLAHYGVKGQKHGQRRYQNEDGTLTPEGRAHYGVEERQPAQAKPQESEQAKAERRARIKRRVAKGLAIAAGVGLAAALAGYVANKHLSKRTETMRAKELAAARKTGDQELHMKTKYENFRYWGKENKRDYKDSIEREAQKRAATITRKDAAASMFGRKESTLGKRTQINYSEGFHREVANASRGRQHADEAIQRLSKGHSSFDASWTRPSQYKKKYSNSRHRR